MSRIAYILLCHKEPEAIVAQANRLTAAGDYIAIHFDASAEQASFDAIKQPCLTIQMSPSHAVGSNVVGGHGHWFRRHCIPLRQRLKHFPKRRIFI